MKQKDAYSSPWTMRARLLLAMWGIVYWTMFRPTPKPLFRWRAWLLSLFGCQVTGRPFVAASAVIKMPWNLILDDRACLGAHAEVYNLGKVTLGARSTIAQQAYLCGGTHDFSDPSRPLVVAEITVGEDAFIGARAFIGPGIIIGEGAVVGAASAVFRVDGSWGQSSATA